MEFIVSTTSRSTRLALVRYDQLEDKPGPPRRSTSSPRGYASREEFCRRRARPRASARIAGRRHYPKSRRGCAMSDFNTTITNTPMLLGRAARVTEPRRRGETPIDRLARRAATDHRMVCAEGLQRLNAGRVEAGGRARWRVRVDGTSSMYDPLACPHAGGGGRTRCSRKMARERPCAAQRWENGGKKKKKKKVTFGEGLSFYPFMRGAPPGIKAGLRNVRLASPLSRARSTGLLHCRLRTTFTQLVLGGRTATSGTASPRLLRRAPCEAVKSFHLRSCWPAARQERHPHRASAASGPERPAPDFAARSWVRVSGIDVRSRVYKARPLHVPCRVQGEVAKRVEKDLLGGEG